MASMKNSKWQEYRGGQAYYDLRKTLAEQNRKSELIPAGEILAGFVAAAWRCHWCDTENAIGEAVCSMCAMPKLE